MPDKQPELYNVDAEKAVLGSVMMDTEAYYSVAAIIDASDFFIKRHGWMFDAVSKLHRDREPVDPLTVAEALRKKGRLEEAGGMEYVFGLAHNLPSALSGEGHARIVREESYRRRLLESSGEIAKVAYKADLDIDGRRVEARKAFDGAEKDQTQPDALSAEEAVRILYDQVGDWAANPLKEGEVRGISTGLRDLDTLLDGIEAGLYLVGAVQHTGKTAFCQQIAVNAAKAGRRVLMISMEHSAEYMYHRIASALSKLDIRSIRHGLDDRQLPAYYRVMTQIESWPLEIIGKHLTMTQIEAEIRARKHAGLSLVVIDNLEQSSTSVPGSKEYVRLRGAAYWMLGIAQDDDLHLPIFTTMQIGTKKVAQRNNKRPEMDDLYGSDGPVQAASVVILLHRPDRWLFDDKEHSNLIETAVWKDKINFTGTGKGRKFVFGPQGQIWDQAPEAEHEALAF